MPSPRRLVAGALVLASLAATSASAETLRTGHLGTGFILSHGAGASANDFGAGVGWSLHASWQPMTTAQRVGWVAQLAWIRTWYGAAPAAPVSRALELTELEATVGLRLAPTETPGRYLVGRAGATLLRTNEAIPPNDERAYVAAVGYFGYEQLVLGTFDVSLQFRYDIPIDGPSQVGAELSIGTGF